MSVEFEIDGEVLRVAILAAYFIGWAITARILAPKLAKGIGDSVHVGVLFLASIVSVAWPVVGFMALVFLGVKDQKERE